MKIRFAQLDAAYAAFNKYAAIMIAKTRVQSGGSSLLHLKGAALIVSEIDAPESAETQPEDFEISQSTDRANSREDADFFKQINFAVEHQNKYCTEFVEYVFSAWARRLDMNPELHAFSMARTSVNENQT